MEPHAARQLTFHGAVVTLVGLLAGIPYSMVATERILGSERAWRFAHVGNILGGLILIAVAGVVDRLDLVPARRTLVAWSLVLGAYADAVGIVAAATFDVRGLTIGSSLANTIVFLLLALGAAADFVGVGLVALGARRGLPAAGR